MSLAFTTHAFLRRVIAVFGWIYIVSFFTFIGLLVYTGHAGTSGPDATHTVSVTSHGRTYYLTTWQSEILLWAGVICGVSALIAVISIGLTGTIKRRQHS